MSVWAKVPQINVQEECQSFEAIEHIVMQISWLGQRQFTHLLEQKRFCLTLPQFYTLIHLKRMAGECKMSDLAEATHQSAASLTGIVDRLLAKDLVARTRHDRDRRQVMVALTSRGNEIINEIKQARQKQMQTALTHLSLEEVDTLIQLLDRTLEGMMQLLPPHAQANGKGKQ